MALVITPVPGNAARVSCSGCSVTTVLRGFSTRAVRLAVEVAETEHACAA